MQSLMIAESVGLTVPKTLVSNSIVVKSEYIESEDSLITKPIGNVNSVKSSFSNYGATFYTQRVFKNLSKKLNRFPELFQENIEKLIELRIFFLCSDFYATAIFRNTSETELTDSRDVYNKSQPRYVPYKLPKHIESKLLLYVEKSKLDIGCIDMIISTANEYYFLEVNPAGIYDLESYHCNYNIDKIIANKLVELYKKSNNE